LIDAVPTGWFGCVSSRGAPDSLEVTVDGRLGVGEDDGFVVEDGSSAWRRWCGHGLGTRHGREHSWCSRRHIHHGTLPVLHELPDFELEGGQVVHLDLQVVDDALDAWAPLVEHLGCGLERVEAGQRRSRSGVDLMLDVVEAFVDLLKKQS
jgi:hypothetical protein